MLYFAQDAFLGNQLWPLATIISFARKHDLRVVCPGFRRHSEHFPYFANDAYCRFPASSSLSLLSRFIAGGNPLLLRAAKAAGLVRTVMCGLETIVDLDDPIDGASLCAAARRQIVYMHGLYFIAHQTFTEAREPIREIFRIHPALWQGVKQTIRKCRNEGDVIVGFHIRRGDYLDVKSDLAFSLDDYRVLAQQTVELFSPRKVIFLVCTTDKLNADDLRPHDAVMAPGHYVQDLYCLANADVILGPPSTFSQWASFYGNVPLFTLNTYNERAYDFPVTTPRHDTFNVCVSGCARGGVRCPVSLFERGLLKK